MPGKLSEFFVSVGSKGEPRVPRDQLKRLVSRARAYKAAEQITCELKSIAATNERDKSRFREASLDCAFADRVYSALLEVKKGKPTIPITMACLSKLQEEERAFFALLNGFQKAQPKPSANAKDR